MKNNIFTELAHKKHKQVMRDRFYKAVELAVFFNRRRGNSGWNYDPAAAQSNLKIACAVIGIPYRYYPNLNPDTVLLK